MFMMWAIHLQDTPLTLILDQEINLAGLAVIFGFQANARTRQKQDAAIIQRLRYLDLALRAQRQAVPGYSAVFWPGVGLAFHASPRQSPPQGTHR